MPLIDLLEIIWTHPNGNGDWPCNVLSNEFLAAFYNAPGNYVWCEKRSQKEFDLWAVWCAMPI